MMSPGQHNRSGMLPTIGGPLNIAHATFTSLRGPDLSGYQLTSCPDFLDQNSRKVLSKCSPTQVPNGFENKEAFAYYRIRDKWHVVSRSTMGAPEYSDRGNRQIVTKILLLSGMQFARYENHPMQVISTAMSLGLLTSIPNMDKSIDSLQLPARPILKNGSRIFDTDIRRNSTWSDSACVKIMRLLNQGKRIAMAHEPRTVHILCCILNQFQNLDTTPPSFCMGLPLARHRSFDILLLPEMNSVIRQQLRQQSVMPIDSDRFSDG